MTDDILEWNEAWAWARVGEDPDFFARHAASQSPSHLWIGCSDSRVSAGLVTGRGPGEMFVHRNVGNLVRGDDPNLLAVVEFAVNALGVGHVVVCGHYGCGAVRAALEGCPFPDVDRWIEPIRGVARAEAASLAAAGEGEARMDRLVELNVAAQIGALSRLPAIRAAREEGRGPVLHGWVYDLRDGRLRDLGCGAP